MRRLNWIVYCGNFPCRGLDITARLKTREQARRRCQDLNDEGCEPYHFAWVPRRWNRVAAVHSERFVDRRLRQQYGLPKPAIKPWPTRNYTYQELIDGDDLPF